MKSIKQGVHKARVKTFLEDARAPQVSAECIHLISCIGVETELALLAPFLRHYKRLGVPTNNFHLILNSTMVDSANLRAARLELSRSSIAAEEEWIDTYDSETMWQKRRDVQRRCVPESHWVVSADADEFHEYPCSLSLFLAYCRANDVNCVDGVFIDRVARGGELPSITEGADLESMFPTQAMVQGQIAEFGRYHQPSGSVKLMVFDAALLPDRGGHRLAKGQSDARYIFGRPLADYRQIRYPSVRRRVPLKVHHFKWHAGLLASLNARLSAPKVSKAGAEYGRKIIDYFKSTEERIDFDDIVVYRSRHASRRWDGWRLRISMLRAAHYARIGLSRIKRLRS